VEVQPALSSSYLKKGDVFYNVTFGGGGYGDPLDRDPVLVLNDVQNRLVSAECGAGIYGVVLDADHRSVDEEATRARREALRSSRKKSARAVG
jgi:N-methylhydantoinase B/oxoprolinase/acetone carboxylase alpha subunit